MRYETVVLDVCDGVATLQLNRPAARNAFNGPLLRDIRDALAALAANPQVRALILTGTGASFCAGADLNGQTGGTREQIAEAVAREAGITRPVVYGHFGDLRGLLEALVERETAVAEERPIIASSPGRSTVRKSRVRACSTVTT